MMAALLASAFLLGNVAVSSARPTQQDLQDARAKLAGLNHRLDVLVENFDQARIKLHQVEGRLADARVAADRAHATAQRANETLGERARLAYEGAGSGIDVILGATTLTDFSDSLEFLNSVAQSDVDAAIQAEAAREAAARASAQLRMAVNDRIAALRVLSANRSQIESAIAAQQALVARLQKELSKPAVAKILSQPSQDRDPGGGGGPPPSPPPPPPSPPPASGAAVAVKAAHSVIGVRYKWGGASPEEGFDCSGLTMWSWAQAGVSLPHSSAAQYDTVAHVSRADLRPGDLLFFYHPISHVAMYIGHGAMIHATHPGGSVTLESISRYWWDVFTGAGRP